MVRAYLSACAGAHVVKYWRRGVDGAVEHLKKLCYLGLPAEDGVVALPCWPRYQKI